MKLKVIEIKKLIERERELRKTLKVAGDFAFNDRLMDQVNGQLDAIDYIMNGFTQSQFEREVGRWFAMNKPAFAIEEGKSAAYCQGVQMIKDLIAKVV